MAHSYLRAFLGRDDLQSYGTNGLMLFALQMRFQIEDIETIATNALTDNYDDKKCDLVYVDREGEIAVIAQGLFSKSSKNRTAAPTNKATDLNTAAGWLLGRNANELSTENKLQPAAEELQLALKQNQIRRIEFWYVHNLPESQQVKDELQTVENTAKAALVRRFENTDTVNVRAIEVGNETLEEWYIGLTVPVLITDPIIFNIIDGYQVAGGDWAGFVTALSGQELYGLFKKYGEKLFSANLRGYLGSRRSRVNINNGIKTTAQEHPVNFWVYNNGITALVNDLNYDPKTHQLKINGLSIVNGAQTTGAIGNLAAPPPTDLQVPIRFITCQNPDTLKNIIKFNNTQNSIEAPDFKSNDPIQKRLVREFESIPDATYFGGRRGGDEDIIRRTPNLLPSETVAQALASFHQDPINAYNGRSQLWINEGLYDSIFNRRTTAKHIVFTYSLLKVVQTYKDGLRQIADDKKTGAQRNQAEYFKLRGSNFFLVTAIAASLETFLSTPIADTFRISFGSKVSPSDAVQFWMPILNVAVSLVKHLSPAFERGTLKSDANAIKEQVQTYKDLLEATKQANIAIYSEFSERTEMD